MARGAELAEAMGTSLASETIEWGANLQVCEILEAEPSLAPAAMRGVRAALKRREPVPVLLGLSLLEMIVKNCGIAACRAIDGRMAKALLEVIKHRESWQYGMGRNLHKFGASFLPGGAGVDEAERGHWLRAKGKVLEILQLSVDAFLLHEGELRPLFDVYKQLRKEGYNFPGRSASGAGATGASAGGNLALVRGSQESPAYLAGLGGAPDSAPSSAPASPAPAPAAPPAPGPAPAAGLGAEEVQELRAAVAALGGSDDSQPLSGEARAELEARLRTGRPRVQQAIEESAEGAAEELDEVILHGLLALLEDLDRVLAPASTTTGSPAAAVSSSAAPAPVRTILGLEEPVPPVTTEELVGMRRVLEASQRAALQRGSAAVEAERSRLLAQARAASERLTAFVQADFSMTANDLNEVMDLLDGFDELLGGSDLSDGEAPAGEALPPRPSAKPPDVEEQERYDLMMARFLQDQEDQAARREEEADARLAFLLANGVEPARAQAEAWATAMGSASSQRWYPQQGLGRAPAAPTRTAPPARVIQAGGAPELLIGGEAAVESGTGSGRKSSQGRRTSKVQDVAAGGEGSFGSQPLAQGLLGGGGGSSSSRTKAWARWAPSGSSSGKLRSLGDGVDAHAYGELADDAAPLVEGGAPRRTPKGFLPWKRKSRQDETRESLLSRVRVDDEWELVRPPADRPYWYNSSTGVSQWQPPSVVAAQGGP